MDDEEKVEPPLWLIALTRAKNREYLGGEKNKGDMLVCGLDETQRWCEKTVCEYCGRDCYYVPGNLDLLKEDAKKICPFCALEKHYKDLPEEFREVLKKVTMNDKF